MFTNTLLTLLLIHLGDYNSSTQVREQQHCQIWLLLSRAFMAHARFLSIFLTMHIFQNTAMKIIINQFFSPPLAIMHV